MTLRIQVLLASLFAGLAAALSLGCATQSQGSESRAAHFCKLPDAAREAAVSDLHTLAAEHEARLISGSVELELRGDKAQLRRTLDAIIARENQCCSFFDFGLEEGPEGYQVRISAEGGGAAMLGPIFAAISAAGE